MDVQLLLIAARKQTASSQCIEDIVISLLEKDLEFPQKFWMATNFSYNPAENRITISLDKALSLKSLFATNNILCTQKKCMMDCELIDTSLNLYGKPPLGQEDPLKASQ